MSRGAGRANVTVDNSYDEPVFVQAIQSISCSDLNHAASTMVGFTGDIHSLFHSLDVACVNDSTTNPKEINVILNKPVTATGITISTPTGNFSNVKIMVKQADGTVIAGKDESAVNTKYTGRQYAFGTVTLLSRLVIQFHTADTVSIGYIHSGKYIPTLSQLYGVDEDTGVASAVKISGGDFNVLARLRNATGNTKINPATSDNQTNGNQIVRMADGVTHTTVAQVTPSRGQVPGTGPALQVQIGPGDVISSIPIIMDYPHHQIHEGETWETFWTGTLNGAKDFRIFVPAGLTPTTRTPHFIPEVISDAATATIALYEGTTWSAGGVTQTWHNRNRNQAGQPNTQCFVAGGTALTPNVTGTQFYAGYLWAGARGSNATSRELSEFVLKPNTEYQFRVTTSASGTVLVRLNIYEDLGV